MAATRDLSNDPPESTQLRVGDDVAWSDINGVYDRDDSLKGNTNPKCLLTRAHHAASSSSQRFSGNLKSTAAPIIGLPGGKLGQGGGARRGGHPPAIFPKKARTGGGGRQAKPAVPEPGSPKVSCFGKVRSVRERSFRRRPSPPPRPAAGCCAGLGGFLMRRSRSRNSAVECVDHSPPPPLAAARRRELKEAEEEEAPAPGLGGLRRFSSGRRAADWAAETEDDGRVARSGPL
jgi:hypothetical protein